MHEHAAKVGRIYLVDLPSMVDVEACPMTCQCRASGPPRT
jgi:hypothetical protein